MEMVSMMWTLASVFSKDSILSSHHSYVVLIIACFIQALMAIALLLIELKKRSTDGFKAYYKVRT